MRLLHENAAAIEGRLGGSIEVRRIVARDVAKSRGPHVAKSLVSADANALLEDPEIDVVVEVAGGVEQAGAYVQRALEAGKSVVTGNKALIADRGTALLALSQER